MPGGIDARKVSRSIDSLGRITPDPYKRLLAAPENCGRLVASLDRKRLGQILGASGMTIRGVFDEETRRKALAFAADAVRYGI